MKILGIETSCDETAVAIIDEKKNILSHFLNSQIEIHKKFGGVIPELAARGHIEVLDDLILQALQKADLHLGKIDGFAATCGPGLIGGVIVGMMAAKTLASVYQKPFIAVNHLEAHALTVRLTYDVEFPYLLLLISGGHCQILIAHGVGNYEKLGQTIDDALGEAFDKVAQMLGLTYPGGPAVEKLALEGNTACFKFSRPLIDGVLNKKHLCDFSFSGLKTAVRRQIEKLTQENFSHLTSPSKITTQDKANICASFQLAVSEIILNRLDNVQLQKKSLENSALKNLVIAGGVAANGYIFSTLQKWARKNNMKLVAPPLSLCTDNAAMVAWCGIEKMRLGIIDKLDFKPSARWQLSEINNVTSAKTRIC
jgi:N6-L-threonylcarbamoyladenine synthase